MNKRIIITGINGFVGKHLTKELKYNGIAVIGVGREALPDPEISEALENYYFQDIAQSWPDITEEVDAIINLAGLAAVGPSFDSPQLYININSAIVTNMCEYYLKKDKKPRIISVISGAIYSPHQTMPLSEVSAIALNSPYAVSKVLNEKQLAYYHGRGLECIAVRPFNHIGPGQLGGFLVPDILNKLTSVSDGGKISVGNTKTRRDYTDVRDVVRAYRLLALSESLTHDTYNVCSGKSVSGGEIIEKLITLKKIHDVTQTIDPSKVRPNDPMDIVGDYSRINKDTGWKPEINLDQTLADCVV